MNREQAITNLGFGRAFAALAPAPEDKTLQVDFDTFVSALEALPGYAEIDILFITGSETRSFHIMARDIPGPDRRFTNLTHGTEWLGIAEIIKNGDAQYVYASRHDDPGQTIWVTL